MEDNPYILRKWENIAKLTPYCAQTVRKKFGDELKRSGLVSIVWLTYQNEQGKRRKKRQAVGSKHLLQHYFLEKAQKNEL